MVSLAPPAPVVKIVAETVAVKDGATSPLPVTVMVPSCEEMLVDPVVVVPRFFDAGALMATAAPAGPAVARVAITATSPAIRK